MNMQMTGQYIPGSSILHRLDGRSKFFGFLLLTAVIILTDSVAGYALTISVALLIAYLSHLPFSAIMGSVRRMLWLFVIIFLLNALFFSSNDPIWQWWVFTLSVEGLAQGANVALRIVLILILSNVLTLTTTPMEIMGAIETSLRPLVLFRIPVDEVAMILSVAIQFIPTLLEETDTIKKAQIARGARFESKKLHERMTSLLPLALPIFMSAFKKADELSLAMEARGYRDARHRTKKVRCPLNARDWASIALCAAFCAAQAVL